MRSLGKVVVMFGCTLAACSASDESKTGTTAVPQGQDAGGDTAFDSATGGGTDAAAADTAKPDTATPDTTAADSAPCPAAVCETGWTKACTCADGAKGTQSCKDGQWDAACTCKYPPKPGEPGWIPQTIDANGCQVYEHWVPQYKMCMPDNPQIQADELYCWSHGQVNDLGVGKPCWPGVAECTGLKASCCHIDDRGYGAICSMYCAAAKTSDPACGPNAWCGPMHVCMPDVCAAGFTDPAKPGSRDVVSLGLACDLTTTYNNADGVGTKCTTSGAECTGKASMCLGTMINGAVTPLKAGVSSFCTHECLIDADCGAGATCIYQNNKPYFCAPTTCKAQFNSFTLKSFNKPDPSKPVCNQPPAP